MRLYREVREDERRGYGVSMLFVIRDEQAERDAALGAAVRHVVAEWTEPWEQAVYELQECLPSYRKALMYAIAAALEAERDD